jgi:outer membrane protein
MIFKTIRVFLAVVALLWVATGAEAAQMKIAVVDSGEVIFNSSAGKRVQETLKRKNEELSRDLDRRSKDLRQMIDAYEKQAAIMKKEARQRKEEELTRKGADFKRKWQSSEQEFAKLREQELKPLLEKFNRVVEQVARDDGYTLILNKQPGLVLYFDNAIDITNKVRSAFGR